jgi:hypothetical protein
MRFVKIKFRILIIKMKKRIDNFSLLKWLLKEVVIINGIGR